MQKKFMVVIEQGLDGYFIGEVPELPGCYSQAKTKKALLENMKEAIEAYLETLADLNEKPELKFVGTKEVVVNATA